MRWGCEMVLRGRLLALKGRGGWTRGGGTIQGRRLGGGEGGVERSS